MHWAWCLNTPLVRHWANDNGIQSRAERAPETLIPEHRWSMCGLLSEVPDLLRCSATAKITQLNWISELKHESVFFSGTFAVTLQWCKSLVHLAHNEYVSIFSAQGERAAHSTPHSDHGLGQRTIILANCIIRIKQRNYITGALFSLRYLLKTIYSKL